MTELLASFAAAGGAPPPSHELVRVSRDGSVRALAGTAWPGLGPISEAGVYAFELDAARLAELERLVEAPGMAAPDDPPQPGSGSFSVKLGEAALRWPPWPTACARCWSRRASTRSPRCGWRSRRRPATRSG